MTGKFWYVYMLQSTACPERFYVGLTEDLANRLAAHNSGKVFHTSKFRPWQVETAVAFRTQPKAVAFEKYLKSHSGRAFAEKHF
ncbi:MAG: GIY-YIG nuclease family protein [Planctomycetaceae bacterium]|nr:GIY-YIG nuclease family protein [Planctomycetaceae bacterium]